MNEKKFTTGIYVDEKHSQYGGFLKISVKVDEFIEFLNENKNEKGYVHINAFKVREKKEGKNSHYCTLYENQSPNNQTNIEKEDDLPL